MKRMIVLVVALVSLLSACGGASGASATQQQQPTATPQGPSGELQGPPPTVTPLPTATPLPPLASIYVYIGTESAAILNITDSSDASVVVSTNYNNQLCLKAGSDTNVVYQRIGMQLYVTNSSRIGETPFAVNADGTLTHNVTGTNGVVYQYVYHPSSIQNYDQAVANLAAKYPYC